MVSQFMTGIFELGDEMIESKVKSGKVIESDKVIERIVPKRHLPARKYYVTAVIRGPQQHYYLKIKLHAGVNYSI